MNTKRILAFYTAFALVIWGLNLRIALLSDPAQKAAYAVSSEKIITAGESRGMIYDRNYAPLVNCVRRHMAAVLPTEKALSLLQGNTPPEQWQKLQEGKFCTVALYYRQQDTDDIRCFDTVQRYSPGGIAQLIGYTDGEGNGVCGLEKSFDSLLHQCGGTLKAKASIDACGKPMPGSKIELIDFNYLSPGGLVTTIDRDIQALCDEAAEKFGLSKGAVVVLDVQTSEILASASYPYYDPNRLGDSLENPDSPFLNRVLCAYAAGSVFKAITAAAALEAGISADFSYTCTGSITVGNQVFHCHKHDGHGTLDMSGAMENSCNTYFISLAQQIGGEAIAAMAKALGLGKSLVLADAVTADSGTLPDDAELSLAAGTANLSFGQGSLTATPLQMAAVYACIANDGLYTPPYLLKEQLNNNGDRIARYEPDAGSTAMSQKTAETLRLFLTNTVEKGSGQQAKPGNGTAAGKTATAQSGIFRDGEEIMRTWFCGFFPADNPRYCVTVIKEEGDSPILDCAPVFRYLAEHILLSKVPAP